MIIQSHPTLYPHIPCQLGCSSGSVTLCPNAPTPCATFDEIPCKLGSQAGYAGLCPNACTPCASFDEIPCQLGSVESVGLCPGYESCSGTPGTSCGSSCACSCSSCHAAQSEETYRVMAAPGCFARKCCQ